jgi:DNA-binding MarR family transcriptional regulator
MTTQLECEVLKAILTGKECYSEIKEALGLKKSVLTEYKDKLLAKGLIVEYKLETDKRKKCYKLNENELIILTVNEALSIIKAEIGELTLDEEQKLRNFLLKHIRPLIEINLKENRISDVVTFFKTILSTPIALKLVLDANLSKNKTRDFNQFISREGTDEERAVFKAATTLPEFFVEKWSKTEFFRSNPIITFQGLVSALEITKKGSFRKMIRKLRKRSNFITETN